MKSKEEKFIDTVKDIVNRVDERCNQLKENEIDYYNQNKNDYALLNRIKRQNLELVNTQLKEALSTLNK